MTAPLGRPARELSDEDLEHQGTQAHATRNWVFLHGTAAQFATHTARMMELEQEYLRRFPKRTWQGSGGAVDSSEDALAELKTALGGIVVQLQALVTQPAAATAPDGDGPAASDPVQALLARLATSPGGRMHKLELHQAARECGVERSTLAGLYTGDSPALVADRADRVLTETGRARISGVGQRSPS